MLICPDNHQNANGQNFCVECGLPLGNRTTICPHGHANSDEQNFCGHCGAPIAAPVERDAEASPGRWAPDPTCRHLYRFWDGSHWTEHVGDTGVLGTDPLTGEPKWYPDTWLGIAAGVMAVLLIVGAISAIAIRFSRNDGAPTTVMQADPVAGANISPSASGATTASAPASAGRVALIGKACRPASSNAVTPDGAVAYCERLENTDRFMWSLFPGDIESPYPPVGFVDPQEDPGVAVCMEQLKQSSPQCVIYLQRPSNPGDGQGSEDNQSAP